MPKPTPLARRIKKLREQADLSRADLAAKMGVKPPSVHDWENGDTSPRLDHLPKLADLLGVSVDVLLGAKAS